MPQLRPANFCRHHQRIHTPADDMLLGAARGAMLEKVFPWIVFFGVLLQPACLQRLFLRAGPRLFFGQFALGFLPASPFSSSGTGGSTATIEEATM